MSSLSLLHYLIDIEPHLYQQLSDRYHALAASALSDLTEDEIVEVTARPEDEVTTE